MPEAKKYKVLGDEGSSVDINGTEYKAGDVIELTEADAQAHVDGGKLELVNKG